MSENLVSIVVPVYNMADSIEKSVHSLCKQDYTNIEILLVDDGSTDDSYDKCSKLAQKDPRIMAFHTENRGSGPARNYGIAHAKGRYIYFPDADDYIESNAISTMVTAMNDGKYDLLVFGYRSLNQNGVEVIKKEYPDMYKSGEDVRSDYADYMGSTRKYGIQGAPWNKFFDLSIIKKAKVEYPPLRRHQDEGFIARYMCYANNIKFISDVLYIHYVNDLKLEWQKYPVDYYEIVRGLYQTRKDTILQWNPKDIAVKDIISIEYICGVIKACELTWSPKHNLTKKTRFDIIKKYIKDSKILDSTPPNGLGRYQRLIINLGKGNRFFTLIKILHFKVLVEKYGVLRMIRR